MIRLVSISNSPAILEQSTSPRPREACGMTIFPNVNSSNLRPPLRQVNGQRFTGCHVAGTIPTSSFGYAGPGKRASTKMNLSEPSDRSSARPFHDVRMRGFQDRSEVADVIGLLDSRLDSLPAETIDVQIAAHRVLAADVRSEVAVPAFHRAAMDGYALRGSETFGASPYGPLELEVIGVALPGKSFAGSLGSGQGVRIMTGAPIPEGADAVLQAEATEEADGKVRVTEAVPPGRHVGQCGEDIESGSIV